MKRLAVIAALVVFLSPSALAGGQQPLSFSAGTGFTQGPSEVVEQQSNYSDCCTLISAVVNPLQGCFWDINDHTSRQTVGYLDPASDSSLSYCVVFDPSPVYATRSGIAAWWNGPRHWVGVTASSKTPDIRARVCFDTQQRCFDGKSLYDPSVRLWRSSVCAQVVYDGNPLDPAVGEIPGSGSGLGVVSRVTVSVANTGQRRVRDVSATAGISSDTVGEGGCAKSPAAEPALSSDYPFRWVD